jgi:selenocysteine lyase/cysteine desulfurase
MNQRHSFARMLAFGAPAALAATLYQKERIACTGRGGADRPGIRLSPHFYNLESEIDRAAAAIRKYVSA